MSARTVLSCLFCSCMFSTACDDGSEKTARDPDEKEISLESVEGEIEGLKFSLSIPSTYVSRRLETPLNTFIEYEDGDGRLPIVTISTGSVLTPTNDLDAYVNSRVLNDNERIVEKEVVNEGFLIVTEAGDRYKFTRVHFFAPGDKPLECFSECDHVKDCREEIITLQKNVCSSLTRR